MRRLNPFPRFGELFLTVLMLGLSCVGVAAEDPAAVDTRLDQLFGAHVPYRAFLHDLQTAVAQHARVRVAGMVSYPFKTHIGGRRVTLRTPAQFLAQYDSLLPPRTRNAIARQSFGSLFANSQGVMIGTGEVWFSGVCNDRRCSSRPIKIIALNP